MERLEVVALERRRGRKGPERADDAGELAIERGGVDARRLDQPALGGRTIIGKRPPYQNAREQGAGKNGAEDQNQQVNPERTQALILQTGSCVGNVSHWRPDRPAGRAACETRTA